MSSNGLCSDEALSGIMNAAEADTRRGLDLARDLLLTHPEDFRLHFLVGSLLAELGEIETGIDAMRRAVRLAPAFNLARFQLGFLLFTTGKPDTVRQAQEVWGPLLAGPDSSALKAFAMGLSALALDQFSEAAGHLRRGLALNADHPELDGNIRLLITEIEAGQSAGADEEAMSDTQLLLQQHLARPTRH